MKRHRPPVLAQQNFGKHRANLLCKDLGERFSEIYRKNIWGSPESVSGLGSTIEATTEMREGLRCICRDYDIRFIVDAPCGDYGWMSTVELGLERYLGLDIVPELIVENRKRYSNDRIRFEVADITRDPLPRCDLVLCRDCLVHLSFTNIQRVLANIQKSGSRYLLTTTFPDHDDNVDIEDGDWRLLNLEKAPFKFPEPLRLVTEGCTEMDGAYDDKSLGLWRVETLAR